MSKFTVPDAVKAAKQFLISADPDDPPRDVRLEEVATEKIEEKVAWAITLGMYRKRDISTAKPLGGLLGMGAYDPFQSSYSENRVYKTIYIDQDSGEFIRMEIRQL
jgi:hypothetical protein